MFAVRSIALLCLVSVSHSATDCTYKFLPLDHVDPLFLEGKWTLVAGSLKVISSAEPVSYSKSVVIHFQNSTFNKFNLIDDSCFHYSHNVTFEGPKYKLSSDQRFNMSGILFEAPCPDCVLLTVKVELPHYESEELCLFSRRRKVEPEVLKRFETQVKCLNMPEYYEMDPDEKLCPFA